MSGVSSAQAAASIDVVNQVLANATQAAMRQADKLMKTTVAMAVGTEPGKGQNIDITI